MFIDKPFQTDPRLRGALTCSRCGARGHEPQAIVHRHDCSHCLPDAEATEQSPPPPPPAQAASLWRALPMLLLVAGLAACGGGDSASSAPPVTVTPLPPVAIVGTTVALETAAFVAATLSAPTVGPEGGTLSVIGTTDPLAGATLAFPAGVLSEPVTVALSSAPVTAATGLPAGAAPRGRAIRVQLTTVASGAAVGALRNIVRLTLPVDATTTDAVAYYQLEDAGTLEAMGFESIDPVTHAISFFTRAPSQTGTVVGTVAGSPRATAQGVHVKAVTPAPPQSPLFATYVAIGVAQTTLAGFASSETTIDSGFRPTVNGFAQPNYGSYYADSRGGSCFGMVGFAKYYYQMGFTSPLVDTYRDARKTEAWIDDSVGIELAGRVHTQMTAMWNTYVDQELDQQVSSTDIARGIIGALYVTGRPALVYLSQVTNGVGSGAHAVAVYKAVFHTDTAVTFGIYDPNMPKNDARVIDWSPADGFEPYESGTTAGDTLFRYNEFKQMGFSVGLTPDELTRDKSDADAGYPSSVFPTITITSITGQKLGDNLLASPGTTADGLPDYNTADTTIVIEGTVLGGNAQVSGQIVFALNAITPSGTVRTDIDNGAGSGTGKFKVAIPVNSGITTISLLAADSNLLDHWAAFKQVFVNSTSSPWVGTYVGAEVEHCIKAPDTFSIPTRFVITLENKTTIRAKAFQIGGQFDGYEQQGSFTYVIADGSNVARYGFADVVFDVPITLTLNGDTLTYEDNDGTNPFKPCRTGTFTRQP